GSAYDFSGGTLTVPAITNNGSFSYSGGTMTVNTIDGTGSFTVGSGRTLSVNRVQQGTLTVNGTLSINQNGSSNNGASKVNSLSLGANGIVDIVNNGVIVDYTSSSPLSAIGSA